MAVQSKAIEVAVYTRPSCPRTEAACQVLEEAGHRYPVEVSRVDITLDVALEIAYGKDTPVVIIEGVERFRREVDEHELKIILQTIQMKRRQQNRRKKRD